MPFGARRASRRSVVRCSRSDAALPPEVSAKLDASPHDLRHHGASLLIAAGCSVK